MRRLLFLLLLVPVLSVAFAPTQQGINLPACSPAVHDSYKAIGPDGQQYPTWHPQIDLANGCIFDHEHGSNPALLRPIAYNKAGAILPLYGYTAARSGMPEGHAGFKTYVIPIGDKRMMLTQHQGTSDALKAACARYHTLDIVVVDLAGNLLIDQHLMADFGKAVVNTTGAALTPAACPNQAQDAAGSNGVRQFPSVADGNIGYEPWRVHNGCNIFGFCSGALTFNDSDPRTAVDSALATQNVPRTNAYGPARGAWRFVGWNNGQLTWTGAYTGTVWTDAHGTALVASDAPGSVPQFVAGPLTIGQYSGHCYPYDALSYAYWCAATDPDAAPFLKNPIVTGAN